MENQAGRERMKRRRTLSVMEGKNGMPEARKVLCFYSETWKDIQVIPTDQNLNETEVRDKLVQVGPGFPGLCSHLLTGCSEPAFPCCMEPTHPNLVSPVTCLDSRQ